MKRYLLPLLAALLLAIVGNHGAVAESSTAEIQRKLLSEDDHDDHDQDNPHARARERLEHDHDDYGHDDHDGHDHDDHEGHDHGETNSGENDGLIIGACFLVAFMSFAGIVTIAPCAVYANKRQIVLNDFIYSSAAGCLLATAGFLMLPEAGHLITAGSSTEAEGSTAYGCSLLGGYIIGAVIHWTTDMIRKTGKVGPHEVKPTEEDVESGQAEAAAEGGEVVEPQKPEAKKGCFPKVEPVVWAVLWGDFFHNFVDGIAVAAAFSACNPATGWVVVTGTILHELSQEIADYMVLTNNGLSPVLAVCLNFLSGLSCVIAGGIAISVEMTYFTQGCMLSFGAGTYFWIAATETFNKILHADTPKQVAIRFSCFCAGAVVIGLVLLSHEHCTAGGHEGHNH